MSKPEPDPIYVRASVWGKCNLLCEYCPVEEGMENRVPSHLAGNLLTTERYIRNMQLIAAAGVRGASFTGGEPTLRPDLGEIITAVRPFFDRVELTTNGRQLPRVADEVLSSVDLLKVSLDSLDPARVQAITGRTHAYKDALNAITWATSSGVPLGINVVLMRETLEELVHIIDHVSALNRSANGPVHLSLLDYYYSPSRRDQWLRGFIPTSEVLQHLEARYGAPEKHERFGCTFYWFDADGLPIRLKDSHSATMRAPKCTGCSSYCQEGIYGIKHSCEGWLTTCPSSREDLGVHLGPDPEDDEIARLIQTVMFDVLLAQPDPTSFSTMCATHGLTPGVVPPNLTLGGVEVHLRTKDGLSMRSTPPVLPAHSEA